MFHEQPQPKSDSYAFYEEWESLGELVFEFPILPLAIMSNVVEDAFGNSSK